MTRTALKIALPLVLTVFAGQALAADRQTATDDTAYDTIRAGRLDEAERALTQARESGKSDPFQLLNLAYVMQKQGRGDEAAEVYKQILDMDENPYAQLASGDPRRVKSIARDGLAYLGKSEE